MIQKVFNVVSANTESVFPDDNHYSACDVHCVNNTHVWPRASPFCGRENAFRRTPMTWQCWFINKKWHWQTAQFLISSHAGLSEFQWWKCNLIGTCTTAPFSCVPIMNGHHFERFAPTAEAVGHSILSMISLVHAHSNPWILYEHVGIYVCVILECSLPIPPHFPFD